MRLLFINLNKSAAYGGVERWMMDAAVGLGARGHQSVMLSRPGAPWAAVARRQGLIVREEHYGPWALRVLRTCNVIARERPDLVIVKATKAARMAGWAHRIGVGPPVAILFGLTHELDAKRWVDRYTWRRCIDSGIALAHGAADWYADAGFGPRSKLSVLWKGVDVARFDAARAGAPAVRRALGLADGDVAIGTVGRLAWEKGLDRLFAVVPAVRAAVPRARFFVAGGGRDEAGRVAAAAERSGGAVTLLGQRDDVPELLAAMDLVVVPSRKEVMSQATLEAMAAGRAVVSTRTTGADEAIEDGTSGVLVGVEDDTAMATALIALAGDEARRAALGAAAHRRVATHFTLPRMLDRCEAIFRGVLAGEPGYSPLARER